MREILFKAKRLDNGEWVEGFVCKHPSAVQIGNCSPWYIQVPPVDPDDGGGIYNVDPETVCQYTGMSDKNGAKIFENDIISIPNSKKQGLPGVVKYNNRAARFEVVRVGFRPIQMDYFEDGKTEFEVIGNIYDKE